MASDHEKDRANLKGQCIECRLNRPATPTRDCEIKKKLIDHDSQIGWKNKHLFLNERGMCKMFKPVDEKKVKL